MSVFLVFRQRDVPTLAIVKVRSQIRDHDPGLLQPVVVRRSVQFGDFDGLFNGCLHVSFSEVVNHASTGTEMSSTARPR